MVQDYETKVRSEFAKRLNIALDDVTDAPQGHGRNTWLAAKMGVSAKGAGKWLNGDSIPEVAKFPKLAEIARCDGAWLLFGAAPRNLAVAEPQANYAVKIKVDPFLLSWREIGESLHADEREPVLEAIKTTRAMFAKLRDGPKNAAGGGKRHKDQKTS
jgi:transcriptional regulator with XRE-family HTH domain